MNDPLIESAKEIEALRERVTALIRERNEWRDSAINGGNAGYLRIQLAAYLAEQEPVEWTGCGECDCSFPCHEGEARCIRLSPLPEPAHSAPRYPWHPTEDDYRPVGAAPLSEEVRGIVRYIRCLAMPDPFDERPVMHQKELTQAADLIERLAARITSPESQRP